MGKEKHVQKKDIVKFNYITRAEVDLRTLSKEFSVPLATLGEWSNKEHWVEKREDFQSKLEEKMLNDIAPKLVERREEMLRDIDDILRKSVQLLKEQVIDNDKELTVSQINMLAKLNELLRGNATSREDRVVRVNLDPSQMTLEQIQESRRILNVEHEEF